MVFDIIEDVVQEEAENNSTPSFFASSYGSSALGDWTSTIQTLNFTVVRQNIVLPNGTYFDPNTIITTTSSTVSSLTCQITHNRLVVYGEARFTRTLENNVLYLNSRRIPQTFTQSIPLTGSSTFTYGTGYIETNQEGFLRRPTITNDIAVNKIRKFTMVIELTPGEYSGVPSTINKIIKSVADRVRSNLIQEFDVNLLFA